MQIIEYPAGTGKLSGDKLAPTPEFRKQVGKVVGSIVLFFIVYILLVLAAMLLAACCFYFATALIVNVPRMITILIGLGLIALGISVVVFLFKFIFTRSKKDVETRFELKEAEQPQLFSFIRQLSQETNTRFPKKIYLSPEVNASVFYDSGFRSMFLPVRKNLLIGMGLVNCTNISEFKAVMAHEFGHFSQRSMKLGSFTYNVNKVIYNMLYENTGYTSFLNTWGNMGNVAAIFAGITVKIAQGIQWILRGMYQLINKNYFSLSRQMEFHADAVSASVSGGNNLLAALARIEIASGCYQAALGYADRLVKEDKQCTNIFENHLVIMQGMARQYDLPLQSGIPEVSFHFIDSFSRSRVNYKNQWASHPSLADRKAQLDAFDVSMSPNEAAASLLFADHDLLQQRLTETLYTNVKRDLALEPISAAAFAEWYAEERESGTLPALYRGFYDKQVVDNKDWDIDQLFNRNTEENFDSIYSEENAQLAGTIETNKSDLETLTAIRDKELRVERFEFEGQKYTPADCHQLIAKLEGEIEAQSKRLDFLNKEAFVYCYQHAGYRKAALKKLFVNYKAVNNNLALYIDVANALFNKMQPFYSGAIGLEDVYPLVNSIKEVQEKTLKRSFRDLITQEIITDATPAKLKSRMEAFIASDYVYFTNDKFVDAELNALRSITMDVATAVGVVRFGWYKRVLEGMGEVKGQWNHYTNHK